jgi:hypothetical protein
LAKDYGSIPQQVKALLQSLAVRDEREAKARAKAKAAKAKAGGS